jgi:hypothetical protein
MELLGEAYATSSVSEINIPIVSGYKFYLMLFSNISGLASISVATIADARRYNTGGYLRYKDDKWDCNSSRPSSGTDGFNRCRFVDFPSSCDAGYVMWWIHPINNAYSYGAVCSAGGYKTSYISTISDSGPLGLNVCTPKSFTLSGSIGGTLSRGTGATIYGIK